MQGVIGVLAFFGVFIGLMLVCTSTYGRETGEKVLGSVFMTLGFCMMFWVIVACCNCPTTETLEKVYYLENVPMTKDGTNLAKELQCSPEEGSFVKKNVWGDCWSAGMYMGSYTWYSLNEEEKTEFAKEDVLQKVE